MNKIILTSLAAVAMGVSVQASPVTFNFLENGSNVNLGTSSTFVQSGVSIEAWALPTGQDLYAKHGGGDENGLGIVSDPTHDHEIYPSTYIQFAALTPGFVFDSVTLGSVQRGETAQIYWSATEGVVGTLLATITHDETYDFASLSGGFYTIGAGTGNVLIDNVVGHQTVPDGASTVMLLGSVLTGIGLIKRKLTA